MQRKNICVLQDGIQFESRKNRYLRTKTNFNADLYILSSFTLHFGLKCEIIYQLDAIEYLFVFFQLDMFRAYTPIFRSTATQ